MTILIGFVIYFYFTGKKNLQGKPVVYASYKDIKRSLIVQGSIVPKEEIEVKSNISGVIELLYVTIGQKILVGQQLAKIKYVTDPLEYRRIVKEYEDAQNLLDNSSKTYERNKYLYAQKVTSKAEFEQIETNYLLAKSEFERAQTQMGLVDGKTLGATKISTIITATAEGTILELPIKVGGPVMARGSFSEGVTIAKIANLDSLIFKGSVLETDVDMLVNKMPLIITAGTFKDKPFQASLNFISPKGFVVDGSTRFDIYANIHLPKNYSNTIRAGYSATATFITATKRHAIAVEEKYLQFSNDSIFVETDSSNNQKRILVKTGISDGIFTEIISGIKINTPIKALD